MYQYRETPQLTVYRQAVLRAAYSVKYSSGEAPLSLVCCDGERLREPPEKRFSYFYFNFGCLTSSPNALI